MAKKTKAQTQNPTPNSKVGEALSNLIDSPVNELLGEAPNAKLLGTTKYSLVPLSSLISNPENPRIITLEDQDIKELAESILSVGLIQPLVVQVIQLPNDEKKYIVHAGNRRYHALLLAEQILENQMKEGELSIEEAEQLLSIKNTVPVMEYSGDYAALPLIENGMRKDLDPIFESNYIVKCINQNKDFEHWAKQFGRSHVWVRQRYELRKLIPEVKEFEGKGISLKQLLEVAKRPAAEQMKFAKAAKERFDNETKSLGEIHINDILWKSESTIHWPEEINFDGSPSCKGCEFNSSTFNALFNDGNGKAGTCYNKECFKSKDFKFSQSFKIQAKAVLEYLQNNGYPDAILLDYTAPGCTYYVEVEGIGRFQGHRYIPNSVLWSLDKQNPLHLEAVSEIQLEELISNLEERPVNMLVIVKDNLVMVDVYKHKDEAPATQAPPKRDLKAEEIDYEEINEKLLNNFKMVFLNHLELKTWSGQGRFITYPDFNKIVLPQIEQLEEAYKEFYERHAHRVILDEEVPAPVDGETIETE